MPTKFKRYRCKWCNRTVVVWKMRRIGGRKFCPDCIDAMHEATKPFYKNPPVKAEVLRKAAKSGRLKKVPVKTDRPDYGG